MFRFLFYCIYRGAQKIPRAVTKFEGEAYLYPSFLLLNIIVVLFIEVFSSPIVFWLHLEEENLLHYRLVGLGAIVTQNYFFIERKNKWKKILHKYDKKSLTYIFTRLLLTLILLCVLAYFSGVLFGLIIYVLVLCLFISLFWYIGKLNENSRGGVRPYELEMFWQQQRASEKLDD